VRIKKDSNRGGNDPSNGPYANYIIIRHDDGTYGNYLHFKQNGVVVNEGQRVTMGKLIGFSGNTGYSTDPHLHFHVSVADAFGGSKTVPFKVYTKQGPKTPTLGMVLGD
jgi:murein DD-endopeptidase MepM/ murein hydrolase activator NlpD